MSLETVLRLTAGRDRIKAGFCKYKFFHCDNGVSEFCARGAVLRIHGAYRHPDETSAEAELLLARVMSEEQRSFACIEYSRYSGRAFDEDIANGCPKFYVANYNNHPATTQADIVDLFDKAIALGTAELAAGVPEVEPAREMELVS